MLPIGGDGTEFSAGRRAMQSENRWGRKNRLDQRRPSRKTEEQKKAQNVSGCPGVSTPGLAPTLTFTSLERTLPVQKPLPMS